MGREGSPLLLQRGIHTINVVAVFGVFRLRSTTLARIVGNEYSSLPARPEGRLAYEMRASKLCWRGQPPGFSVAAMMLTTIIALLLEIQPAYIVCIFPLNLTIGSPRCAAPKSPTARVADSVSCVLTTKTLPSLMSLCIMLTESPATMNRRSCTFRLCSNLFQTR